MKITIVSYQKHRNTGYQVSEEEYIKRLSRFVQINLCEIKSWNGSTKLPDYLSKSSFRIGLHANGKQHESKGLAKHIQELMNAGNSHFVLAIGGPEGMPTSVNAQLHERWSLSPLTFSHQLARVVLLEVLYRSFDLLNGGRYHK